MARLPSPEATLRADSGGKVVAVRKTLEGAEVVLKFIRRVLSPAWRQGEISAAELNARQALVVRQEGRITAVVSFAYDADGQASSIFITRNPDKLAHLDPRDDRTG